MKTKHSLYRKIDSVIEQADQENMLVSCQFKRTYSAIRFSLSLDQCDFFVVKPNKSKEVKNCDITNDVIQVDLAVAGKSTD